MPAMMRTSHWTRPHGGLYVWLTLPAQFDTSRGVTMFAACVKAGVLYVPGDYCSSGRRAAAKLPRNHLRLSFGQVASEADRAGHRATRAASSDRIMPRGAEVARSPRPRRARFACGVRMPDEPDPLLVHLQGSFPHLHDGLGALAGIMSFGGLLRPLTHQGLDIGQVGQVLTCFGPAMTTYSFPIAALFATTVVYGRLSADNELTACRAGGMSLVSLTVAGPALVLGPRGRGGEPVVPLLRRARPAR